VIYKSHDFKSEHRFSKKLQTPVSWFKKASKEHSSHENKKFISKIGARTSLVGLNAPLKI